MARRGSDELSDAVSSTGSRTSSRSSRQDSITVSYGEQGSVERDELNYEIDEEQEEISLSLEHDMLSAKAYLKKPSTNEGISLFDHLSELLTKVLAERPKNVIDFFEEYSRSLKETRFRPKTDHLQDQYVPPLHFQRAKTLIGLFEPTPPSEEVEDEDTDASEEGYSLPNVMELLFYFEQAGVGLPRSEMFSIALALNKLKQTEPIKKYRFWGKILGLQKNYIVAETELMTQEYVRRNVEMEGEHLQKEEAEEEIIAQNEPEEPTEELAEIPSQENAPKVLPKFPPIPNSTYKEPPEIPTEKLGEGTNKKVYYVCNTPGEKWTMLPDVTPEQITTARKMRVFFTGNLITKMETYPTFPGTEMEYLRAQIARISAGTQVSPIGFYHFDEEEEQEMEEEELRTNYVVNPEFEEVPLRDLVDESLAFWVHHTQHILKQGRTIWWNPSKKGEDEQGEEEEEQEPEEEPLGQEVGPPLLTPLSEDATVETVPPWSVRPSSLVLMDFAVAVLRSNLWPGAYAFATGRKFDNVYIGWGHKFLSNNYSPPPLETIQMEYPMGPEIMEIDDPTPDEEEAFRLAHEEPPPLPEGEEETEGYEDEDDEDEDEDEED